MPNPDDWRWIGWGGRLPPRSWIKEFISPTQFGLGKPGFDVSGRNPQNYYNDPGSVLNRMKASPSTTVPGALGGTSSGSTPLATPNRSAMNPVTGTPSVNLPTTMPAWFGNMGAGTNPLANLAYGEAPEMGGNMDSLVQLLYALLGQQRGAL